MENVISIIIALAALTVLFFAYTTKSKLARTVSYIILASVLLTQALGGLANLISDIEFLNFLEQLFRGVNGLIVFIEVGLIIFVTFFYKFGTKNPLLKGAIIVYAVLVVLVEFGVF